MELQILIDKTKTSRTIEIKDKSTVAELLSELKINPVTVIVARNKEIVMEDEILKNHDEISIITVVSGG